LIPGYGDKQGCGRDVPPKSAAKENNMTQPHAN
jgi:hypothetical protein